MRLLCYYAIRPEEESSDENVKKVDDIQEVSLRQEGIPMNQSPGKYEDVNIQEVSQMKDMKNRYFNEETDVKDHTIKLEKESDDEIKVKTEKRDAELSNNSEDMDNDMKSAEEDVDKINIKSDVNDIT